MKNKRMTRLQKLQYANHAKARQFYDFSMDFCIEDVDLKIEALNIPDGEYIPAHHIIDIYEQQDAIIALKLLLLDDPELWDIGIDSYFFNQETGDVLTIPFSAIVPRLSYMDMLNGASIKVEHRGEFKRISNEWRGLQAEMIANWEESGIPNGYVLHKSKCRLRYEARFKGANEYNEFNECLRRRANGTLIKQLKYNWVSL